jgi:hypothetical protein
MFVEWRRIDPSRLKILLKKEGDARLRTLGDFRSSDETSSWRYRGARVVLCCMPSPPSGGESGPTEEDRMRGGALNIFIFLVDGPAVMDSASYPNTIPAAALEIF